MQKREESRGNMMNGQPADWVQMGGVISQGRGNKYRVKYRSAHTPDAMSRGSKSMLLMSYDAGMVTYR